MLQFLTFRRCAETTAKCLTFQRCAGKGKMQNRATTVLRAFTSRPVKSHLPKVSGNSRKAAHLPKVGEGQYDGMFGHRYLSRAYCSSSPSEGEQKQQENSPASEGARKWPETSEPYSFGRSRENAGRHDSFGRSKRRRTLQNGLNRGCRGPCSNSTPSEGVRKTREGTTPSEGVRGGGYCRTTSQRL